MRRCPQRPATAPSSRPFVPLHGSPSEGSTCPTASGSNGLVAAPRASAGRPQQRCLSASTRRLNERLSGLVSPAPGEGESRRESTPPGLTPVAPAVSSGFRAARSAATATRIRAQPQRPTTAPVIRGRGHHPPRSQQQPPQEEEEEEAPTKGAQGGPSAPAPDDGAGLARSAATCEAALQQLQDLLRRSMSGRTLPTRIEPDTCPDADVGTETATVPNSGDVGRDEPASPRDNGACRSGRVAPSLTPGDQEQADANLGSGRFFVSAALIGRRVDTKLAHYRESAESAAALQKRVREHHAARRQRVQAAFQAALAQQRARRIGRIGNAYETITSGRGAALLEAGGAGVPAANRDDNDAGTSDVPLFRRRLAELERLGTAGFRQVRTVDQLVAHNSARILAQRRHYVAELRRKREHTEAAIRRHDELVADACEQRRRADLAAATGDWLTFVALQQSCAALRRITTMIAVAQRGFGVFGTFRRYFTQWHRHAVLVLSAERRRRLRGQARFALCAARLWGFTAARRGAVRVLLLFARQLHSAGRFKVALSRFRRMLVLCQRAVRSFLVYRRARLHLLLLQWERCEEPLRRAAQEQHRQDVARRKREHDQRRMFMSTAALKAERERALVARKRMTREQLHAAQVKDLLEADQFDFARPVPQRMRLEILGPLWTERRRRFIRYERPALVAAAAAAFARKREAYELSLLAGNPNAVPPRPPATCSFPLFIPPAQLEKAVRRALQAFQEEDMDLKQAAATRAATMPEFAGKYHVLRENLYIQRFGAPEQARRPLR